MRINWYKANGVVGVAFIGPFHFVVNQWHSGDEYRVETVGKFASEFLASFPPGTKRSEMTRFMVKYTQLKVQAWDKELTEWLEKEINVHA